MPHRMLLNIGVHLVNIWKEYNRELPWCSNVSIAKSAASFMTDQHFTLLNDSFVMCAENSAVYTVRI